MSVSITTHQPALPLTGQQIRAELLRQESITQRQRLMERPSVGPRPIADALAGRKTQRSTAAPDDLTARRMLRRGGDCAQAAALLKRAARCDTDPKQAAEKNALAVCAAGMAGRPPQLEFNLDTGGNFTIGYDFLDTITARLTHPRPKAKSITPCQRSGAIAMLLVIGRFVRWKSPECVKSLDGLAKYLGMAKGHAGRMVQLLESAGAIKWATRGRAKIIVVNPEGILHAPWDDRSDIMVAYRAAIHPSRMTSGPACR
jgi:hypothetical protein